MWTCNLAVRVIDQHMNTDVCEDMYASYIYVCTHILIHICIIRIHILPHLDPRGNPSYSPQVTREAFSAAQTACRISPLQTTSEGTISEVKSE